MQGPLEAWEDTVAKRATAAKTTPRKDDREDRLFVKSVGKAFKILEAFADSTSGLSLSELAGAASLDKSATQRLVHTMLKLGYLERTSQGHRPGRRLVQRSFDYLRGQPLVSRAVPILAELRRDVQERVDLSLFDDTSMLYLIRLQSKRESLFGYLNGRAVGSSISRRSSAFSAIPAPPPTPSPRRASRSLRGSSQASLARKVSSSTPSLPASSSPR